MNRPKCQPQSPFLKTSLEPPQKSNKHSQKTKSKALKKNKQNKRVFKNTQTETKTKYHATSDSAKTEASSNPQVALAPAVVRRHT